MADDPGCDADTRDRTIAQLLAENPGVDVITVTDDGAFVPMPASMPWQDRANTDERSPIERVAPPDRVAVVKAWEGAKSTGVSNVVVRTEADHEQLALLHLFDVRERHGVLAALLVRGSDLQHDDTSAPEQSRIAPRLCRATKNELAVFRSVDAAFSLLLGYTSEEMEGARSLDLIHPDDHERALESWMDLLAAPGEERRVRLRHRHSDGSWLWFEITNVNRLADPERGDVLAEMLNISDEMAAMEGLRSREQLLNRLAEALPLGLFQVDLHRAITYTNDRLHRMLAHGPATVLVEQFANLVPHDMGLLYTACDRVMVEHLDAQVELRLVMPHDGSRRLCRVTMRALSDDSGVVSGAIACLEDVTEAAQLRAQLEERAAEMEVRATSDILTGCSNRSAILATLESTLEEAVGAATGSAVVFVDLDRFKPVNDSLGHAAGDELLAITADCLRQAVRATDVVGRLGGDEFLVVCPGVTDPGEATRLAERISSSLHREVSLAAGRIHLRASVGVAWAPVGTVDADTLIARADQAMYVAKANGDGNPVLDDGGVHIREVPTTPASTASARKLDDRGSELKTGT